MIPGLNKIGKILLALAAIVIIIFANITAQDREERHPGKLYKERAHEKDRKETVVKVRENYREVIVKDKHYFFREGIFYERGPKGFAAVTAPLGARIDILPVGFRIVHVRRVKYYLLRGVYYRFLPRERVYVVVKVPL